MYLNRVQVLGNITKNPELKSLPSGQKVCSFSIATNETYKDREGNKKEKVEYHNIVAWGITAQNIAKYMSKGSQIYVEGKLQTRSWEAEGKKLYRTEIMANNVQFGNNKNASPKEEVSEEKEEDITGGYEGELDSEINPDDIPF
jgi:single-strand DNA-binding protein